VNVAVEPPYSEACERNKDPILAHLESYFRKCSSVLEIGTGTAQHAVHFARALPHLTWVTSDLDENLAGIRTRLTVAGLENTEGPLSLDVSDHPWPIDQVDAVFTANTLHIMSWDQVKNFFRGVGGVLTDDGTLIVYGPFTYDNKYTSRSNANFDLSLKHRDPKSGIRDFKAVNDLARQAGLKFVSDNPMPANNQLLVWKRV
jgi:cyclopropane fatty-acyl-phospholipid synthase-like methyltransferase